MKINVLGIVKGATELVVSTSVGAVVGNVVRATTPDDLSKYQRVVISIGSYALGGVLGSISAVYVSNQIDEIAKQVNGIIHPSEEVKEALSDAGEAVEEVAEAIAEQVKDNGKQSKSSSSE